MSHPQQQPTPPAPPPPPTSGPSSTPPRVPTTTSPAGTPAAPPKPVEGYRNPRHEWLTYETLFNHRLFRRTNQGRDVGLYRIRLSALRVVLGENLTAERLEQLRAAFFPEIPDTATLLACADHPWQAGHDPAAARAAKAKGGWAVLPFNYKDNDPETPTIGAGTVTRHRTPDRSSGKTVPRNEIHRLEGFWSMWSTASRSCVVRVEPPSAYTPPAGGGSGSWKNDDDVHDDPGGGPLAAGKVLDWPFQAGEPLGRGRADIDGNDMLTVAKVAGKRPVYFSVKTGVTHVAGSPQGPTKATLADDAVLPALRSGHVVTVDRRLHPWPTSGTTASHDVLVVLPEILTVTEDLGHQEEGDGYQVRDLSALRGDHHYFPALSVPYVGPGASGTDVNFDALAERWAGRTSPAWIAFWEKHFAEAVGRAKAELLLRYGLQPSTANSQNFLLEFDPAMKPTGRVVVRDLGDAVLHTQALWAMFGADKSYPTGASYERLSSARFAEPQPHLDYERTTMVSGATETARDATESFPADTQFNWTYYTSLSKGSTVATPTILSTDPEAQDPASWRDALAINARWGRAHNNAYVGHLRDALGLPSLPMPAPKADPARYQALKVDQFAEAGKYWETDLKEERDAVVALHRALISTDGLKALRAYTARRRR